MKYLFGILVSIAKEALEAVAALQFALNARARQSDEFRIINGESGKTNHEHQTAVHFLAVALTRKHRLQGKFRVKLRKLPYYNYCPPFSYTEYDQIYFHE